MGAASLFGKLLKEGAEYADNILDVGKAQTKQKDRPALMGRSDWDALIADKELLKRSRAAASEDEWVSFYPDPTGGLDTSKLTQDQLAMRKAWKRKKARAGFPDKPRLDYPPGFIEEFAKNNPHPVSGWPGIKVLDMDPEGQLSHRKWTEAMYNEYLRQYKPEEYEAMIQNQRARGKRYYYEGGGKEKSAARRDAQKDDPDFIARRSAETQRRNTRVEEQTPAHYNQAAVEEIYKQRDALNRAMKDAGLKERYEVDHVVPIRGQLPGRPGDEDLMSASGLNVQDNLLIVPANLNNSKGNHFIPGADPMTMNEVARRRLLQQAEEGLLGPIK